MIKDKQYSSPIYKILYDGLLYYGRIIVEWKYDSDTDGEFLDELYNLSMNIFFDIRTIREKYYIKRKNKGN